MKHLARELRKNQTDAEKLLWSRLRNRQLEGCKFRRQQPLGPYIVDLVCLEAKLILELDGGQHNEPQGRTRDERRTQYLQGLGYRVLRYWNPGVLAETDAVMESIRNAVTLALSHEEREEEEGNPV